MSALVNRMSLPVRRAMFPDEWGETYLVALARAQGLRRPWGHDVELIRGVLPWGQSQSPAGGGTREARIRYLQGRPQYGDAPLPTWASLVRAMPLRYCPECLIKERYFRTRWRLSGLHACTFHGCLLKADLADPALTVNYRRDGLRRLVTVQDDQLIEAAHCCLPRERHAISMVWRPFEQLAQTPVTAEKGENSEQIATLASWSVLAWRALEEISRAHHKKVLRLQTGGQLAGVGRLVEDLGIVLAPTMEGMLSLFAALRENVHVLAAKRLLEEAIIREQKEATALSLLPLQKLSERVLSFSRRATPRTPHGAMAFRDLREHTVNRAAALEQLAPLGASSEVLERWIRCKLLPTVQVSRRGRHFVFIEREHLRQVRRALSSLIHARDFATEHCLSWTTYKAIRDSGLLRTGALGLRGFLYRKDISHLTTQLELMSAPEHQASALRWRLFGEATLQIAEQRGTFRALVKAAVQGQIKIYRDLSRPGLSAFSIGVDGITWLTARRKAFFLERRWRPCISQPDLFDERAIEIAP